MATTSSTAETRCANVAILGDSRAFDTYYTNDRYEERYGYDSTFPFLLRHMVTADPQLPFEVIHIPDHFRAGTAENNIIRLALLNPAVVVLLDGIWETLIGKEHFVEYATRRIKAHDFRSADEIALRVSGQALVDLYLAGELSVSPSGYAEKQRRLISYFRRRRRQCVWLTLPVPDAAHFDRLHFAGDYRCLPNWGRCLAGINDAVAPMIESYGGHVIDLDRLMAEHGGSGRSLIDQWHFTRSFHATIARCLAEWLRAARPVMPAAHASNRHMLAGPVRRESVVLCGAKDAAAAWTAANRNVTVETVVAMQDSECEKITSCAQSSIVVLLEEGVARVGTETRLLRTLSEDKIILYPEELARIVNPPGDRRAEQGQQPSSATE